MNLHIFLKSSFAGLASLGYPLPSLEKLLAVGRHERMAIPIDEAMCEKFGVGRQQDYPLSALRHLGEGVDEPDVYSLMAMPVHLVLQRDHFVMQPPGDVTLAVNEADDLIRVLNDQMHPEGLTFLRSRDNPNQWYLLTSVPHDIQTTHLDRAAGRNVSTLLPQGRDAARWNGYVNQLQMLLHEHPVNRAREARGELPINSLWIYGGGQLPPSVPEPGFDVMADDALARGLAALTHAPLVGLTEGVAGLAANSANKLLVLENGQAGQWEEKWFLPILAMLKRGGINTLSFYAPAGSQTLHVTVRGIDLLKFWRPRKSLNNYPA